jgi:hypothetical protein
MKFLIVLIALLIPVLAGPVTTFAGPCGDYEYDQLQDMDRKTLLQEYCKAREISRRYASEAVATNSLQAKNDFNACFQLIEKMERIYLKRFKNENLEELRKRCKSN